MNCTKCGKEVDEFFWPDKAIITDKNGKETTLDLGALLGKDARLCKNCMDGTIRFLATGGRA